MDGYEITGECFKADKEKLAQALPQEIPNFSPGKAGAIHKYALKFFGEHKAKCFLLIEYKDRADSIWISKIDTDPSCNSILRQYGAKIPTIKNWFN
ncbi:hypothetical protein O5O45_19260 [Hahella aquimaris]|uniref:hypothetical protein n=1 Tax=Hahella sp. HNIBRBA332 TaxID=3015983 RepID=UPI00273A7A4B|nr:hypothetical protein [Hahella sp. HNIBRBA332]WLQ11871.1 hypothetical protein O5O45_19260 [Hahella sp. HNIBRBA332]